MSKNTNKELHENVNFRSVAQPATYKGPTLRIQSVQIVCCYQLKMGAIAGNGYCSCYCFYCYAEAATLDE